jgi:hypothetical protein
MIKGGSQIVVTRQVGHNKLPGAANPQVPLPIVQEFDNVVRQ